MNIMHMPMTRMFNICTEMRTQRRGNQTVSTTITTATQQGSHANEEMKKKKLKLNLIHTANAYSKVNILKTEEMY